jgi:hypothetical protein
LVVDKQAGPKMKPNTSDLRSSCNCAAQNNQKAVAAAAAAAAA